MDRIAYDEFSLFHENAEEFGLPYDGPPVGPARVRGRGRPDRRLSALVWGEAEPELVFLHGGAQNAHTWDTVAMALDRPLVAIDLPGHGYSDGGRNGLLDIRANAADIATAIRALAPNAPGRDRDVARRHHHHRPRRRLPRAGAEGGARRHHARRQRAEVVARSPSSSTVPRPSTASTSCSPARSSTTRPARRRHCGAGSCTTPSSSTTARGSGATSATAR